MSDANQLEATDLDSQFFEYRREQIEARSAERPAGYTSDFLSLAREVRPGVFRISRRDYETLAERYRLPALRERIRNFARALADAATDPERLPAPLIARRLSVCGSCVWFVENSFVCSRCGCALKLKTQLRVWHCPDGKW